GEVTRSTTERRRRIATSALRPTKWPSAPAAAVASSADASTRALILSASLRLTTGTALPWRRGLLDKHELPLVVMRAAVVNANRGVLALTGHSHHAATSHRSGLS